MPGSYREQDTMPAARPPTRAAENHGSGKRHHGWVQLSLRPGRLRSSLRCARRENQIDAMTRLVAFVDREVRDASLDAEPVESQHLVEVGFNCITQQASRLLLTELGRGDGGRHFIV